MLYFRLCYLLICVCVIAGCDQYGGDPPAVYPQGTAYTEYFTSQAPIGWEAEQSLLRLSEYVPQGKAYPKAKAQLRFHDVFFRPYQVSDQTVSVSGHNTVSLSDMVDHQRLHPEAIGFQVLVHNPYGLLKSAVFPSNMKDSATWASYTFPVPKRSWRNTLSGKKRLPVAQVWVREILPMPQGQTFRGIAIPEQASLEFNLAYASPLGQETARAIPLYQWHQALTSHPNPASIPVDPSLLERIPLLFKLTIIVEGGEEVLFEHRLDPNDPALTDSAQGWQAHSIDLSAYAGKTVSLRFTTHLADSKLALKDARHVPVGTWGSPILYAPRRVPRQATPNVIFISLDTLRADHLGCYGYARNTSPVIDAWAAESMVFEECIATSSWTLPTHASIFTGLAPSVHGATGNYGDWRLDTRFDTVAELLHAEGYATAAFTEGVVVGGEKGFHQGFDLYSDGVADAPLPPGTAEKVIGQAVGWLEKHEEFPFFLFLHTYEIHDTYQAPPPFLGKFAPPLPAGISTSKSMGEREGYLNPQDLSPKDTELIVARYDEGIAYTDAALGRLFRYLNDSGLNENTMVVLFSDHGEEFYEHGALAHQKTLYQEQLHVPLIIRMPGSDPPRGRVATKVSQLDFFSTIVEALNLTHTPPATSFSLMPFLRSGGVGEEYRRRYAPSHLEQEKEMTLSIQDDAQHYIVRMNLEKLPASHSEEWEALRARHDTSFESRLMEIAEGDSAAKEEALYRLAEDALEQENRAKENPSATQNMRSLMNESLKAAAKTVSDDDTEPLGSTPLSDAERADLEALGYL